MVEVHTFGPFAHRADSSMSRADLEVYGINHFRPSYVALIFFNDPGVSIEEWSEDRPSYAGRFAIFGHQTCIGDEGHCEVPVETRRFDDRPSHPLTPAFKRVIVTNALRRCLAEGAELTVTVLAAADPGVSMKFEGPLLDIKGLQLTTFG